jgi:hypothetical protein
VEGSVRNSVTGEALSKANIIMTGAGRPQPQNTPPSATHRKIRDAWSRAGQFRLMVRRNGYVSSDQSAAAP